MGYCKNCHSIIEDGLKYCDDCAQKINSGDYSEDYLDNLLKSITDDNVLDEENQQDNVVTSTDDFDDINHIENVENVNNSTVQELTEDDLLKINKDESSKDDMDVLEQIFDNFSTEKEDDNEVVDDGSNMNIEDLILEGNKYSEEIQNQIIKEQNEAENAEYDENGKYIANDSAKDDLEENIDNFIDNSSEDELLDLLNSMSNDNVEVQDNIDYGQDEEALDSINEVNIQEAIGEEAVDTTQDESVQDIEDEAIENFSSNLSSDDDLDDLLNSIEQMDNEGNVQETADETSDNSNEQVDSSDDDNEVDTEDTTNDIMNFMNNTSEITEHDLSDNNDEEYSTEDGTVFMAKPKKSLLQKLFGNVPDKKKKDEDELSEEDILKEAMAEDDLDDEESKAVNKKEEKEKKKKEKEEQKKELKARKAREKEEKKRKAAQEIEVDTGRINKVGATIIFVMAAGICVALIFIQRKFSYFNDIRQCEKYYDQGQYSLAYLEIAGMELKNDDDKELYTKLRTIMYVQQYVDDSNNFFEIKLYDKSANSLLISLGKYKEKLNVAKENEVDDVYEELHKQILESLDSEFGISEECADYLLGIEDNTEYTKELRKYTQKLEDAQEGKE